MQYLKQLMAAEKHHQKILGVIFLVYIVSNVPIPTFLANMVNTPIGTALTIMLGLSLLGCCNPIVAVLGLIACYDLIKRSGSNMMSVVGIPSELSKMADMKKFNSFPKTLEEEVVQNMVSPVTHSSSKGSDFKPVLCDTQGAAPINYEGFM